MQKKNIKLLVFCLLALGYQEATFAACQSNSYVVSMEFPDGSFVSQSDAMPFSAAHIADGLTRSALPSETVKVRAEAVFKALTMFEEDPSISRAALSASAGGDGRIYEIHHHCNDDVVDTHKYPRVVGYTIRTDSSRTIWSK